MLPTIRYGKQLRQKQTLKNYHLKDIFREKPQSHKIIKYAQFLKSHKHCIVV